MSLLLALLGGGVDGAASGATITVTASLIPGTATGGASVNGATLPVTVSVIAGVATGGASAAGATVTVIASLIDGVATGGATASGATVSVVPSLIDGQATGGATANGATVSVVASLIDGVATGGASANGSTVSVIVSLIAGQAAGDAVDGSASGDTLNVAITLIAGVATATTPVVSEGAGAGAFQVDRGPRYRASINAIGKSGQGRQETRAEFSVVLPFVARSGQGAQTVDATGSLSVDASVSSKQTQSAKVYAWPTMRAAIAAKQARQQSAAVANLTIDARIKSGVVAEPAPTYDGDPLPDIFLAS